MDRNQSPPYPENEGVYAPQEQAFGAPRFEPPPQSNPVQPTIHSNPYTSSRPNDVTSSNNTYDDRPAPKYNPVVRPDYPLTQDEQQSSRRLSKKWQRRLYWMVPLGILAIVIAVLFEVYKKDFERWAKPLTDWLRDREAWSWTLPVAILVVLSFPPLFGHEVVLLIVGLTYPLGVALGIACAGAVLGEAACFIVFKYIFTGWVEKKIAANIKWAATARVAQEAGFRGVLVIRYSIVPPHLANPLFACTGMKFWLYMATVFLSLPKNLVFVALGTPASENSKGAKWAKVVAIGVVVVITLFASWWIRKKMTVAIKEIQSERAMTQGEGDEEFAMLTPPVHSNELDDSSYHGAATTAQYPYQGGEHDTSYNGAANTSPYPPYSGTAINDTAYHGESTTAQYPYEGAAARV